MATSNRRSSEEISQQNQRPRNVTRDVDPEPDEENEVIDDDVSNFFDEEESEPGDRRRDPLRHGIE